MAESGWAKKHVFCSEGIVAEVGCKTLVRARVKSRYIACYVALCLTANGPAVEGVNVTRRKHPITF